MLIKVEKAITMTVREAQKVYNDKWFRFRVSDKEDGWSFKPLEDVLADVIYIADDEKELLDIPEEESYGNGGIMNGIDIDPDPGLNIGGLEIEEVYYRNR